MNKKSIYYGILFSLFMSSLVFFMGYTYDRLKNSPKELYQVYLDGKVVGVINNENDLYNLIDKEQKTLKNDYNVDKIYPPNNLEVAKVVTYNDEIMPVKDLYEKIKDTVPFTIKGYEVTIDKGEELGKIVLNVLNEKDFDDAINTIIRMFVNVDTYESYLNGTQEKDFEEGTILEKVSLEEKITIKETFISTKEKIYTKFEEISRFLLFGTDEATSSYTIEPGDTIKSVANNHKLNSKEFLIVNPEIKSENTLLFPGQIVNIGYINPVVTVVTESTVVENQSVAYNTQTKYDTSMAYGTTKIEQAGVKGIIKVKFRVLSKNGYENAVIKTGEEKITSAIDEIIVKGGHKPIYVGESTYWAWPTLPGYRITSEWAWRTDVGSPEFHKGVDISGPPHGSPIFSIQGGTVTESRVSNYGLGIYVTIDHNNGYTSTYAHLSEAIAKVGDTVSKGDIIGLMGNTGRSTGTHLHLEMYYNNVNFDPLTLYK